MDAEEVSLWAEHQEAVDHADEQTGNPEEDEATAEPLEVLLFLLHPEAQTPRATSARLSLVRAMGTPT
jgi:hypothetical protein